MDELKLYAKSQKDDYEAHAIYNPQDNTTKILKGSKMSTKDKDGLNTAYRGMRGSLIGKGTVDDKGCFAQDHTVKTKISGKTSLSAAAAIISLGVLFFFKYFNFFQDSVIALFNAFRFIFTSPHINK